MRQIFWVGTSNVEGSLSSYETALIAVLEANGYSVDWFFAYGDTESVPGGAEAGVVFARGAHGLGTKWRNCGVPVVGTGRSDLWTGSGTWNHASGSSSGTGNDVYYNDAALDWTGQTAGTSVNINATAQQLGVTGLDADALILGKVTNSAGNPMIWAFDGGETVDGVTLTDRVVVVGLTGIYWQGGVQNSAGEQMFVAALDYALLLPPVTIAPNDISISLTADNATISQNHIITTNDIALSLTEDSASITQNHIIATSDVALGLTIDASTISQDHVLALADIAIALTADNTTIAENHVLTPDDIAIRLITDGVGTDQSETSTTGTYEYVMGDTTNERVAQTFQPTINAPITSFIFKLAKKNSPSDSLKIEIYTDFSGSPDTLLCTSDEILGSSLPDVDFDPTEEIEFTFASGSTLSADTDYWAVLSRTGATDNTDNYRIQINSDTVDVYSRGISYADVGSWDYTSGDEINYFEDFYFIHNRGPHVTIDLSYIISPADISIGTSLDNNTLSQNHLLTSADIAIGLTEDSGTITQNHIISPDDIQVSLSEDATTIDVQYSISTNDIALGLTIDSTTITQNHIISPSDIAVSTSLDATSVSESYILATDDIAVGLNVDATTISQDHVITPDDIALSTTADSTSISQNHSISANDITLSTTIDSTVVSQDHVLSVNDISISLTEDSTTISQNHNISPSDISLGTSVDQATVIDDGSPGDDHILSVDDISVGLTVESPNIVQNHVLATQDLSLSVLIDSTDVDINHIIDVQDIALATSLDETTIAAVHVLSPEDINLLITEDSSSLSQQQIILVDDILISLMIDNTNAFKSRLPKELTGQRRETDLIGSRHTSTISGTISITSISGTKKNVDLTGVKRLNND